MANPVEHVVDAVKCDPKAAPLQVKLTLDGPFHASPCFPEGQLFSASGPPGGPLGLRILRRAPDDVLRPTVELFGRRFHAHVTVEGQSLARTETLHLASATPPADLVIEFYRSGGEAPSTAEAALEALKKYLLKLEITP